MLSQAGGGEFLSNSLFLEMNRTMPEIIYSLVARGSTVLAEFTKTSGNFPAFTRDLLAKTENVDCQVPSPAPLCAYHDWSFRRLTRFLCDFRDLTPTKITSSITKSPMESPSLQCVILT